MRRINRTKKASTWLPDNVVADLAESVQEFTVEELEELFSRISSGEDLLEEYPGKKVYLSTLVKYLKELEVELPIRKLTIKPKA